MHSNSDKNMDLKKPSILVLLILVMTITTGVCASKKTKLIYVNVDDYYTCLPLLSRPRHTTSVSNQTINLFGETLEASRHYVIPYNILATFFTLVLREDPGSELGAYLARRVRDIWAFYKENEGNFPPTNESRIPCDSILTFEGGSATFVVDHRMLAAFTWLPGNTFYGPHPSRRTNDPKGKFDEDVERIVGTRSLVDLRTIYNEMDLYINYLSRRTTTNFDSILNGLSYVAKINTPCEFNEADWEVTGKDEAGNKLFGIKKPADGADYRKKRWAIIGLAGMCDDYMKAADRVCEVYMSHLVPKFNSNFTHVDINYEIFPLLVYSINNKHFVFGQSNLMNWTIRTVEQDGRVGAVTDQGSWSSYYDIQLLLEINGKHFLYRNELKINLWHINELNADGTIGIRTDSGIFERNYQTQFIMNIDGNYYLYGRRRRDAQSAKSSNEWFLRILNTNGTMGSQNIQYADGTIFYTQETSPIYLGDKPDVIVYTLNTNPSLYCIRETDVVQFHTDSESNFERSSICASRHSCSVVFPVSIGGKTYIFGYKPDSRSYIIRNVSRDILEQNHINYEITDAKPFNLNGVQYFYARHKGDSHWSLHRFDFKYLDNDIDL